jgi:hypothetical protein
MYRLRRRRHDLDAATPARREWPSGWSVHVLHGDDELREAIERATACEELIIRRSTARTSRYARLAPEPRLSSGARSGNNGTP